MTDQELDKILADHFVWLDTKGKQGKQASFKGARLNRANFGGASLQGADFQGARLNGANFKAANLEGANLRDALLRQANLEGANLRNATLELADLKEAHLELANLSGAILFGAHLENANLKGTQLQGATLRVAKISAASLRGADLVGADLEYANLDEADLRRASLQAANLQHAQLKKANLERTSLERADLRGANLKDANLQHADLENTKLYAAYLVSANLQDANLRAANLRDAELQDANLTRAFLREATLRGADLRGADLADANLDGADLERANLDRANLDGASLKDANLTGAILPEGGTLTSVVATGRKTRAISKLKSQALPLKAGAFKKLFPIEFEKVKEDTRGADFTPELLQKLIAKYGVVWSVAAATYKSDAQRVCGDANEVLLLTINMSDPVYTERQVKNLKAARGVSERSGHPVAPGRNVFTVGWVRYCDFSDRILVEEVQSDVTGVRKGLKDPEFRQRLKDAGISPAELEETLALLAPFADRFYEDALGLIFDIAEEQGKKVEMLDYAQKKQFGSPRNVYTDLPKSMGMKLGRSEAMPELGQVWTYTPNRRKRTR